VRIVLDTNVLISAFLFPGGAPEAVLRLALEGKIELVSSTPLLAEFGRVLTEKFGHDPGAASERVKRIVAVATIAKPDTEVREIGDDPDDDRVLEAALASDAAVIVSGDKHLLRLGAWRGIRILAPAAFLEEFESR
jgi:putative PIN family toxin of toxin-antitoxin system